MASVKRFEDLEVWQLSRELCKDIYNIIEFPSPTLNFEP